VEGDRAGGTEQFPLLLSGQKRKHGHPLADGYDISSMIAIEAGAVRSGEVYTPEEMFGKYLDLVPIYDEARGMRHAFAAPSSASFAEKGDDDMDGYDGSSSTIVSYLDFLSILSRGLNTSILEPAKLRDRRKYVRFLQELQKYLIGFLKRTSPFLDVLTEVIAKAILSFDREWGEKGGVDGWECSITEAAMVLNKSKNAAIGIDLGKYATSSDLEKEVSGDELKLELDRLGLKCGGTVKDRAARLFLTKDTPLDKLPAKVFAKKKGAGAEITKTNAPPATGADPSGSLANTLESVSDRRVDIARLEAIVSALIDQLRPTLDGTRRRIERRSTQTENERDQELDEEINGASTTDIPNPRNGGNGEGGGNDSADEDDEDDAPIYNPKNVPLDWNGKPIPYWLFKLHGLNHFYACEICGNESYRGRRNFEKHFAESRHAYGMRCLSIPNTKHFHGVTKISDAQDLWGRLRKVLEGNHFDVDEEEEYEDSHGNVVNRVQYEDLARQGML
jgi:splicing factor 3A subunit 3